MIGKLANTTDPRSTTAQVFGEALTGFAPGRPVIVMSHFDADGLSAAAILIRALTRAGHQRSRWCWGKGETPWDEAVRARLAERSRAG
jgi:single-stranded-DNA-specific exonuclease